MSRSRRSRILTLLLLLGLILVIGTGCSPNQNPPNPTNGFWDAFFVYPLYILLNKSAAFLFGEYGLAILVVTIIIRLLVLPLTIKQLKSSKAMQVLQPEMVKLREKYKDNPQKIQEETMKLFQKHNVNPFAGCFPLLVQMPILIAFYHAIMRSETIHQASFLWLQLGAPDPFYILPIVAGITTYFQTKMMGTAAANNPQTKMLMTIMPFFILFIAITLPSALSLYWVYGNLFTIIQSYFLRDLSTVPKQEGTSK